ncbi:MAG: hypothetical protein M1835_006297 [Candelina submexicana]|nr:MAG: hypothetical protein M1835_006297 [Candelina submexicana]
MTVDEILTIPTEALAVPSPRLFYPASIPPGHWQLRSLISLRDPHTLYYASENEIWCLHTDRCTRKLIATLPWRPLCLVVSYGWVCAGGHKGLLAAVKLSDHGSSSQGRITFRRREDVDALLSLDLNPELRRQAHQFLPEGGAVDCQSANRKPEVQMYEVAHEVVNSITLHKWCKEAGDGHDDTVAVIASNDKTVRIFSLTQSRLITTLSLPYATNQARVSPDGKLLVAVGDAPVAFFYSIALPSRCGLTVEPEWSLCSESQLEPPFDSQCSVFGYFPTAFSPSGHLCAVGSQDGIIIVLDTSLIRDPQIEDENQIEEEPAVIAVIESSRPRTRPGAIRSLYFAPQPLDLLIWTEDHGRVCVADMRENFRARQIIHLDTTADSVERAQITELSTYGQDSELRGSQGEAEFIARYRRAIDAQDDAAAVNFATEYIAASSARLRHQRLSRERLLSEQNEDDGGDPHGLTEREQQILDALRISRERADARERTEEPSHQSPMSVNYPSSGPNRGMRTSADGIPTDEVSRTHQSTNRDTNTMPSLRDYIHERNLERTRTTGRSNWPRRRNSIVLPHDNANQATSTPVVTDLSTSSLRASPPRLPSTEYPALDTNPWRTIEAAMSSGPLPDAANRLRREREQAIEASSERRQEHWTRMETARRETLRSVYTRRAFAEREVLGRYELALNREGAIGSDWGVGTTGLEMSPDGRKLYVGTEEGILEYQINIQERKCFPKIDLR